jgi:tetratricopeptide (TPR) repeat protein
MRFQELLNVCIIAFFQAASAAQSASPANGEIRQHAENARLALARNDLTSAEQEYRAILQLDPTNAEVHAALGVALYGSGKFAEAIDALSRTLELQRDQPRAELFLALSESSLGRCDSAIPALAKDFPVEHDAKLRRLAGLSLLDCQLSNPDSVSAIATVRALHDAFPDDPDVLYKSAELYTRLWNQAAGELMQKHPESYRVHQLAGEVFEAQEKNEQAVKEFRLALEENPHVAQLHFRIGRLVLKQGAENAEENALKEFRQELEISAASAPAEYAIAEIYRNRRDFEQATEHFQRAIKLDPEFAEPHVGLAQVFLSKHDYEQARGQLESAIRLQPDHATAHYNLMLVYRSQGNMEAANREMAIFHKLQEQNDKGFQNKLHSLLTGATENASHSK